MRRSISLRQNQVTTGTSSQPTFRAESSSQRKLQGRVMKLLKLLSVLVALVGVALLALVAAPSVHGPFDSPVLAQGTQRAESPERGRALTVLAGRGAAIGVSSPELAS